MKSKLINSQLSILITLFHVYFNIKTIKMTIEKKVDININYNSVYITLHILSFNYCAFIFSFENGDFYNENCQFQNIVQLFRYSRR